MKRRFKPVFVLLFHLMMKKILMSPPLGLLVVKIRVSPQLSLTLNSKFLPLVMSRLRLPLLVFVFMIVFLTFRRGLLFGKNRLMSRRPRLLSWLKLTPGPRNV